MNSFATDDRGNALRYLDLYSGTNPSEPLLLVHGLGCASSSDYPPVVSSDSYTKRRSLVIDLMGAGFSDKPEDGKYTSDDQANVLSDLVASEHFTQVNLFGHSAGAFIAVKLAKRLPIHVSSVILCAPGLSDYGKAMLSEITSMTEAQFVAEGYSQLLARLKAAGGNDAWLGPFAVASPHAIYQWARSALDDNAQNWLDDLARLNSSKAVILPDTAASDEIIQFEQAGCSVELVANTEHMMAYDNPDGLALAISNILERGA
ncbi:alpha/beta hydrolase [Paraburkholderia sp. CNPSo 3272]|uniref:alpha/beta fold hydrolase n=1 Tax=Paraburkholderia sp. CNPSo 3272 TaxID=2940931 RepID=UPI0020B6840F|nr:alpha/beta fold hydrolase [Paraburkholderia sp. CNPSo 3272]MCP3723531.1 alpha/beta hydrolase [Paraburkholderia sp. CNPSo 3272]